MATPFLGLRTVVYYVDDMAKARDWYIKITGVQPYFDQPFYIGFNIGGYELGLHPAETLTNATDRPSAVYWGVQDVQATFDSLIAAGAAAFEEPQNVGDEIVTAAVKDPWGNTIGIIYNPHFKLA